MKIIIDALGADQGPSMVAEAVAAAMQQREFDCVLVGPKAEMAATIDRFSNRIEVIDTDVRIMNEEHPVMAIRRKKNSSLVLGLNRLNETDRGVFLTAGSTGALLAGGYFITGRLPGIERACIAAAIPNPKGETVLVDTGANMDTTPKIQLQFAHLGSAFVASKGKTDRPRVGLLNVGAEPTKGDKRAQETYELLSSSSLNFVGNIEARELLDGKCDVLVADGFAGNVALKALEGTAKTLFDEIKKGVYSSFLTKLGGALLKPVFRNLKETYNYKAHGGAPLLGVKKPLFKAHGDSDADTFRLAILEALDYAGQGVEERIEESLKREADIHEAREDAGKEGN